MRPENKDRTERTRNPYAPGPEDPVRTGSGRAKAAKGTAGKNAGVRSAKDGLAKSPKTNTAVSAGKAKTKRAVTADNAGKKDAASVGREKTKTVPIIHIYRAI